jgi:toxin ParE1/3/4
VTRLVFSPEAQADLEQIGDYIAQDNSTAAIESIERLRRRCRQVAQFPGIGRRRSDLRSGYRSVSEGEYIVLYVASSEEVEIVHILHSKRGIGEALKQ